MGEKVIDHRELFVVINAGRPIGNRYHWKSSFTSAEPELASICQATKPLAGHRDLEMPEAEVEAASFRTWGVVAKWPPPRTLPRLCRFRYVMGEIGISGRDS